MTSKYTDIVILEDEGKVAASTYECKECGGVFSLDVYTIVDYCPCCGRVVDIVLTREEQEEMLREEAEERAQYEADIASAWNDAKGFI